MKTTLLATLILTVFTVQSCSLPTIKKPTNIQTTSGSELTTTLSEKEIKDMLHMYEEEKLAHDVYTYLGEKWNIIQFRNITTSEETHKERMSKLIAKISPMNPLDLTLPVGAFSSKEFQDLYDSLIKKGSVSATEALLVGMEIEELDIKDLREAKKYTTHLEILSTYDALERGSRNHLRAFSKQLQSMSLSYAPKHISMEEYTNIISTPQEKGR